MLLPFPNQVPFRSRMSWARAVVMMAPDRIIARNKGIIGFPLFHVCRINVPHGVAVALPFVVLGVAPVQVRRTAVVILIRRARRGGRGLSAEGHRRLRLGASLRGSQVGGSPFFERVSNVPRYRRSPKESRRGRTRVFTGLNSCRAIGDLLRLGTRLLNNRNRHWDMTRLRPDNPFERVALGEGGCVLHQVHDDAWAIQGAPTPRLSAPTSSMCN